MLTPKDYDSSVDIWSAGCIFGEMLLGRPLFPGAHEINQLHLILDSIGKEDIANNKSFITDGTHSCTSCIRIVYDMIYMI